MAASTLAGAITFTGCAVMPSVTAFADTTEQTGQVSYDNEVMPIHTDVQTEAKPLMKGTSCTVSDGKNLYYAFEMMGVRMGIMKYNTKTGKKSEVYFFKIHDMLCFKMPGESQHHNGVPGKAEYCSCFGQLQ